MSLGYVLKEGFSGFRRARLAAITSVIAIALSLLVLSVLVRLAWNGYTVAQSLKDAVEVELFLDDIQEIEQFNLERRLKGDEIVASVTYISADSAAEIFRREFGSAGDALADLKFLPASFKIKMKEDVASASILEAISRWEKWKGIDEVRFNKQLLELLERRIETLVIVGLGIGLLILLTSVILVFNTIRLTIFAKQSLIRAMKLVGATNGFIRRPFVVEGLVQGLIGAALAFGVHMLVFLNLIPKQIPQLGIMGWPGGRWFYLAGGIALLALVMGFLGSVWASRRFIRMTDLG